MPVEWIAVVWKSVTGSSLRRFLFLMRSVSFSLIPFCGRLPFQSTHFLNILSWWFCMNLLSIKIVWIFILSSLSAVIASMCIFTVSRDSGSRSHNSTLKFMPFHIHPKWNLICNGNLIFFYLCASPLTLVFRLMAHLTSTFDKIVLVRSCQSFTSQI